jgi:hypothetical protein
MIIAKRFGILVEYQGEGRNRMIGSSGDLVIGKQEPTAEGGCAT